MKSAVPDSTSTLCAVCAGVLTIDQVSQIESDQAAAMHAADERKSAPQNSSAVSDDPEAAAAAAQAPSASGEST
eukprot:5601790-Pleurochrysis_carterae.AAC.1